MGVLDEMLTELAREADLEWLMIDSTIVATRYDKLLVNFMGFVKLAAIAICLK